MNGYSTLTSTLRTELLATLASKYPSIVVERGKFRPDKVPAAFTRYGLFLSPNARPWEERSISVRTVQYVYRVDLFAIVLNFDEDLSLFGAATGDCGLFELVGDVKDYLRMSTLGHTLDKTYQEAGGDARQNGGGPVEFEDVALTGFDAGNYAVVRRAKIPYVARVTPFSHDIAT